MTDTKSSIAKEIANLNAVKNGGQSQNLSEGGLSLTDKTTGESINIDLSALQNATTEEELAAVRRSILEKAGAKPVTQTPISEEEKQDRIKESIRAIQKEVKTKNSFKIGKDVEPPTKKDKVVEVFVAIRHLLCLITITYFVNHFLEGTVSYRDRDVHTYYLFVVTILVYAFGVYNAHNDRAYNGLDEAGTLKKIDIIKDYTLKGYVIFVGLYAVLFSIFK